MAAGAGATLYVQHKEVQEQKARDALYRADVLLKQEEAAVAKDKKFSNPQELQQSFTKSMDALQAVPRNFAKSRAGFEALLKLGDLYWKNQLFDPASFQYQAAVQNAPKSFDRALALSSLGYALENAQKKKEAVEAFEKALALGEATLQGDLMLSIGRVKEGTGDTAGAKAMYKRVTEQLPNTDYAKTAETLLQNSH